MSNKVTWQSPSGETLEFGVFSPQAQWNSVGGIYMFCRLDPQGTYTALYIGQAQSLKDRLSQHEQWSPAVRKGASVVLAAVVQSQAIRDTFERQLIQQYQPLLNQQLKGGLLS